MKFLIAFFLALTISLGTGGTKVYICDSPNAVAYHSDKYCRGLQKCTHQVLEVTLKEAENKNLRPCKICY
jgi:hypothetical protein